MPALPAVGDHDLLALGTTLVAATSYTLFHYFGRWPGWLKRSGRPATDAQAQLRAVVRERLSGLALLGLVPFVAAGALGGGLPEWGIAPERPGLALTQVLLVCLIVLPIVRHNAGQPAHWVHYPMARARRWSGAMRRRNIAAHAAYLLGYEFLFRGFLLFGLARAIGPWPAIGVNVLAYVWAHLPKDAAETIACIPMGLLFATIAWTSGSFWPAFAIHLLIAMTNDETIIARNPEIERV